MALLEVSRSLTAGLFRNALRFADRARRLAPAEPTLVLLQANLLIRLGLAAEALPLLNGMDDADARAARAEALRMQGSSAQALNICQDLLRHHAVDGVANLAALAGGLVREAGAAFPGWVGLDSRMCVIGEARGDLRVSVDGRQLQPVWEPGGDQVLSPFKCETVSGHITAFCGQPGHPLLGAGIDSPPDFGFSGWAVLTEHRLLGEARMEWSPRQPVELMAKSGSGPTIVLPTHAMASGVAFDVLRSAVPALEDDVDVDARLPDGTLLALTGSPLGAARAFSAQPQSELEGNAPALSPGVDVVIPVYGGGAATLHTIRAVRASLSEGVSLIVVDDAGTDAPLRAKLEQFACQGLITLLTSETNLGFPGAANLGMRLQADRDVILLNSDAEPFGDWLSRLRAAAYSAPDIGSVTPLGDCASIASYPGLESPTPAVQAAEIDRLAAHVNAGCRVDVPVGVGFCMYLKRACLRTVGFFEEVAFGRGYGEENDFCLRAAQGGWRHVVAADVFVRHSGGRSFGQLKHHLMARNRHVLNARHPGYDAAVRRFLRDDPLRPARRRLDSERLLQRLHAPTLIVTLALPGGVQHHVDQRRRQLEAQGRRVLELRPANHEEEGCVQLRSDSDLPNLLYDVPADIAALRTLLLQACIERVEIHHFLGLGAEVLDLVTRLGVPYQVFAHDYAWICPRINLLGGDDQYCGEPALQHCEACVRQHGTAMEESLTVAALRRRSADVLGRAQRVVAPSKDTANRLGRYFPAVHAEILPWETCPEPQAPRRVASGRLRVAVIGAIGLHKGYGILRDCAADAASRDLALEFIVIGHTHDDEPLLATQRAFVTGPYADAEVGNLLDREGCSLCWFPSVVPETWCYSLSHALASTLPVVAFDLGAIAERLRAASLIHALLPLTTPAPRINDVLLQLARSEDAPCAPASKIAAPAVPLLVD